MPRILVLHRGYDTEKYRLYENGKRVITTKAGSDGYAGGKGEVGLSSDPSAVRRDGRIFVFHEDNDHHGDLWMTQRADDFSFYSEDTKIASELMTGSPDALADSDGVHVYYQQHKRDGFWLAGLEVDGAGDIRSQSEGFPETGITGSPSALRAGRGVLLFHRGRTDGYGNEGRLFFNFGEAYLSFAREQVIPGVSIAHNPCAASWGHPWVFYQGGSGDRGDGSLWGSKLVSDSYTNPKWEHRLIAEKCMSGSPSAAYAYDEVAGRYRLYVYYHGYGEDGSLHVNAFDGHNWSGDRLIGSNYLYGSPSAVTIA